MILEKYEALLLIICHLKLVFQRFAPRFHSLIWCAGSFFLGRGQSFVLYFWIRTVCGFIMCGCCYTMFCCY